LSLAARLGLYAMLAGLVVASFTVTPARRAQVSAAPTVEDEPAAARIAPMSRGLVRELRDVDGLEIAASPIPTPEATDAPAAVTVEPAPEAAAQPEREPLKTPDPTPEPTPPPAPRPVAVLANSMTLSAEVHMLELMNASRVRGGLLPLAMDVGVADTARAHSAAEARVRYVYHDGTDGTANSRDVPACGTGWYGENTGKIWNDNVDALHVEFMNEPWAPINHRTNIMDPAFRRVGVGAVNGPDAMYMTMVFCR
ncbi:MAG TPA: CAP domain-containing protein, partial [Candidatus Limnocylindria bacterium]|nr:CAP domain-containing protein [Candidatus Limnocylindria bacterium]